jgi:5-methylcytosine-specific restriction protein B
MALLDARQREGIQEVVDRWRERCLLEDGSLLFDEQVWTPENLALLYHNVIEAPLEDDRSFLEKYKEQLQGSRALVLLGAEAMAVYYLFAWIGAVTAQTKRERVNEVLSWAGEQLADDSPAWRAFAEGIGHPGQYYLVRMELQIGFIVDFARRLKEHPVEERREILDDPWRLRDFMDEGADEETTPGMRHVLLHLLQPDFFERIASGPHKQSIATTYAGFVEDGEADLDERLLTIRERLEELLGKPREQVDFYDPPLEGTWGADRGGDGADPLEALELQKQLVIFGPPGTSKTYEAKELAKQIIRRAAMRDWGPVAYFERQAEIEKAVAARVRRLQLHPAYSYEEFIRGLRLREGRTVYEDGYLLRLVKEISDEQVANGKPLPWVLILDELNRADLSRVFGEAFSVLEDRDDPVELPGVEPGEPTRKLQLPEHLFVIGTMNLIDQSLEQIDFALRRRFLWQRSGYDAARLAKVLPEDWRNTETVARYEWQRISGEMQTFIERATLLNEQIAASPLLGRDYEIGHTYFFKIVGLLARVDYLHRKHRASRFLWNKRGEPLTPVRDLWYLSLEPLIDQYLQGVDADSRAAERSRLGRVFLRGEVA